MDMQRITIFKDDELHKMMSGDIIVAEDTDGVTHLYMSKQRYRVFRHNGDKKKENVE